MAKRYYTTEMECPHCDKGACPEGQEAPARIVKNHRAVAKCPGCKKTFTLRLVSVSGAPLAEGSGD